MNQAEQANYTGQQVKDSCLSKGITHIDHHRCGGCESMVNYQVIGEDLFFDPRCDCNYLGGLETRSWESAAEWINMQRNPEARSRVAAKFGLEGGDR